MNRRPSLILLRETWPWMAEVSGFDPLFAAIEELPGLHSKSLFVSNDRAPSGFLKRLTRLVRGPNTEQRGPSPFADACHEAAGRRLLCRMAAAPGALALLSAGEHQYGDVLSRTAPATRSRLVPCFHQPPSLWRLKWRDTGVLDGLGGIVCLCQEQQNFFSAVTSTRTILIRHGVSLNFFTPADEQPEGPPRLLVVGHWLRDFDTLAAAMELVWQSHPQVELDWVIPRDAQTGTLAACADRRTYWHADISPEKLRDLYRRAALLFMPLLDAGANNGIVKALACGLPVVSSRVGGIEDYLPEGCGQLCPPSNACEHAQAVVRWLEQPERLAQAQLPAGGMRPRSSTGAKRRRDWYPRSCPRSRPGQDRARCVPLPSESRRDGSHWHNVRQCAGPPRAGAKCCGGPYAVPPIDLYFVLSGYLIAGIIFRNLHCLDNRCEGYRKTHRAWKVRSSLRKPRYLQLQPAHRRYLVARRSHVGGRARRRRGLLALWIEKPIVRSRTSSLMPPECLSAGVHMLEGQPRKRWCSALRP